MQLLNWLENLGAVTWVRESDSLLGYTLYLAGHTIGLVFLIGPNLLIAARVLGVAPELPLRPMAGFRRLMAAGLVLTVVTGLVLFATAPVSYVHNVVFAVKITAVVAAAMCLRGVLRGLFADGRNPDDQPVTPRLRRLTVASLVFWLVAVVAGRLTAYSGVVVVASVTAFLVVLVVVAAVWALFWISSWFRRAPRAEALSFVGRPTAANGGK